MEELEKEIHMEMIHFRREDKLIISKKELNKWNKNVHLFSFCVYKEFKEELNYNSIL